MTNPVTLPLWLLLLILAFAAVTFASHFLFPSVRWFLRRRAERVIARLNARLTRPIEPFKLLRRHDMIQRLIYDPQVMEAVADTAHDTGTPEEVVLERARRYAREIVPSFSATAYFGIAIRAARRLARAFYRVEVVHEDVAAKAAIASDAAVIFVINHRSNMDYVLLTYLAGQRSALSFAAGEWAHVWPLGALVRAMGAYFVRRKSSNALYRRVMARYVQMATRGGVAQAIFPEGGLSLDGKIGPPKLGLLSYILEDFDPKSRRDVMFIPVGLNYDRVLEDRVLVAASLSGTRRFRFRWRDAARYLAKQVYQRLSGRFVRYGYASVAFGEPLSLQAFLGEDRPTDRVEALGAELRHRIVATVPVTPVPVLAALLQASPAMMAGEATLLREELVAALTSRLSTLLQAREGRLRLFAEPLAEARLAINHLIMRRLLIETDGNLSVPADARPLIEYYAASLECTDIVPLQHV